MLDLAIVGATVVTPTGPALLDIGVRGGVTAMLVTPGSLPEAVSTLDAAGKIVLPGGVDPHVHTNAPNGMAGVLGRDVITKAALYGGMTTIIDFVWPGEGSPTAELARVVAEWDGNDIRETEECGRSDGKSAPDGVTSAADSVDTSDGSSGAEAEM